MGGMKTRMQTNGVTGVAAQSLSPHVPSHDIAEERLTNGVRCASVVGMKTRPNTGGVATGVVQPCSYAVVSQAGCAHPPTRAAPQGRRCYTGQHDGNTKPSRSNPQQHITVHSQQGKCDETSKYETQSEKSATLSEMTTMRTGFRASDHRQSRRTSLFSPGRYPNRSSQYVISRCVFWAHPRRYRSPVNLCAGRTPMKMRGQGTFYVFGAE